MPSKKQWHKLVLCYRKSRVSIPARNRPPSSITKRKDLPCRRWNRSSLHAYSSSQEMSHRTRNSGPIRQASARGDHRTHSNPYTCLHREEIPGQLRRCAERADGHGSRRSTEGRGCSAGEHMQIFFSARQTCLMGKSIS